MNKPKIRFKGFNDDWEQRKVSELADDIYGGGTPKTSVEEYWNGTIPWIQSSDITEHDVNSINPKKFISDRAVNKSATKLVPENSIAIVTRVGVGKLVIMPFSYTTSQDFLSLSKLNSDLPFTAYLLYKKMQDELHSVQGTSIKGITKEELLSKEVMITQIEEQKKIGTYFSELDHLITLHQWKCLIYVKIEIYDKNHRKLIKIVIIFEFILVFIFAFMLIHIRMLYFSIRYILLRFTGVINVIMVVKIIVLIVIIGDDVYGRIRIDN